MAALQTYASDLDTSTRLAPVGNTDSNQTFANTGSERLYIRNGSGAVFEGDIRTTQTVAAGGLSLGVDDVPVNLPAGASIVLGPFAVPQFSAEVRLDITSTPVATVEFAVVR